MKFTAKQIAEIINGEVEGNPDVTVSDVSKIEEGKPGTLTFLANPKYAPYIYTTAASITIVNKTFVAEKELATTLIRVDDAYHSMARLLQAYQAAIPRKTGVEQPSFVATSSNIGSFVYIGAFSYIGEKVVLGDNVQVYPQSYIGDGVEIGDNSVIYPGVKIYKGCKIGANCIIHSGAVIGSDGFGFAPTSDGRFEKMPQVGIVILENNVEIGANTTIDRATMGSTIVREGTKLDNLIQVAHNVEIGENSVIAAQSGIAGSTKIGKQVMFGGQVGVAGHLKIADGVRLAAQTGVASNLDKEKGTYMGSPAIPAIQFNKAYVVFRTLPDIKSRLETLEKK